MFPSLFQLSKLMHEEPVPLKNAPENAGCQWQGFHARCHANCLVQEFLRQAYWMLRMLPLLPLTVTDTFLKTK